MQAEVQELVEIRRQIAEYDEAYEKAVAPLKAQRDSLQLKVTEELKEDGGTLPTLPERHRHSFRPQVSSNPR